MLGVLGRGEFVSNLRFLLLATATDGDTIMGTRKSNGRESSNVRQAPDTERYNSSTNFSQSILRYNSGGTRGPFKWGFEVPDYEKRHEWFKLGLCSEFEANPSLANDYPSPTALPRVFGPECERLVVDYLTSLRKHAESYFRIQFDPMIFHTTPREYIITVPAIWTDRAQYITRICAEQAGMGHLQIISEPEAAGIFALDTMTNIGLNVGDTFVVCDAGGG